MSDSAKSSKTTTKPKKSTKPAEHPSYNDMVKAALLALKERTGSSRQAIVKYIKANFNVGDNVETHVKLALKRLESKGLLIHTKGTGASGSFKLSPAAKDVSKPKKKVVKKKPAAKKQKTAKPKADKPIKKPAVKKPTVKKPKAKKAAKPQPAKKVAAKKAVQPKAKPAKKAAAKKPAAKKTAKKATK